MAIRAACCALALLAGASALYEDQAGKLDWYRQNVGSVLHSDFHTVAGRRLIFVSTDVAMVAALDASTGETAWRQPLPTGEHIVSQSLLPSAGALLVNSLTADGSLMVRRWTLDGDLTWDALLTPPADGAPAPTAVAYVGGTGDHVAVLWGPTVALLRGRTGERVWAWVSGTSESAVWHHAHLTADGATLIVYGRVGAGEGVGSFARAELSVARGSVAEGGKAPQLVRSPSPFDPESALVLTLEPRFVATLDSARAKLLYQAEGADGAHSGGAVRSAPLSSFGGAGEATLLDVPLPGAVLLRFGEGHVVLVDLTTGEPHVRWEARAAGGIGSPGGGPIGVASLRAGTQAIVACAYASDGGEAVEQRTALVTPGGAEELPSPPAVPLRLASHGAPAALFLGAYSKRDGGAGGSGADGAGAGPSVSQRALLVTRDGALHGLSDGSALWTREEALARPVQVEFLSLPRARDAGLARGPEYGQLLRMASRLLGVGAQGGARGGAGGAGGSSALVADAFGFRKLLLVRTASSKIYALLTDSGSLAWSALPTLNGQPAEALAMAVVPAAGTGLETDVQLVVRSGSGANGRHAVLTYDGLSGALRGPPELLPGRVLWSLPVPAPAEAGSGKGGKGAAVEGKLPPVAHAFVLADLSVALLPAGEGSAAAFEAARPSSFFFLLEPNPGAAGEGAGGLPLVQGYGFVRAKPSEGGGFRAVKRWTHVPLAGGYGLTVSQLDNMEAVHAPVQVLGDRGVLHKYLNKNLLAVAYTQATGATAEPSVHLTLLDGVSGAAVYHHVQLRASGPVRLALTENTVVAAAHAVPSRAPLLSVVELYENATEPRYLSMLINGADESALRPRSSFEPRSPFALSTAFFLSSEPAVLGFTQTAKGITPRHLLLGLHSGQMLALDKKLLDPRRPTGPPSPADREEGLMSYQPLLGPIPLQMYLTHGHQVERPHGVRCAATTLESTSIVALYGCDLFVSRHSPAKNFDMLAPDFNHVALALAVAGLAVGTVVTTHLRRRQELNRLWR